MARPVFRWTFPKGDSRTARFQVLVDGVAQSLTGYAVVLTATVLGAPVTETGAVQNPDTSALITLTPAKWPTPGLYPACVTATKGGSAGPWTAVGEVEVVAHP